MGNDLPPGYFLFWEPYHLPHLARGAKTNSCTTVCKTSALCRVYMCRKFFNWVLMKSSRCVFKKNSGWKIDALCASADSAHKSFFEGKNNWNFVYGRFLRPCSEKRRRVLISPIHLYISTMVSFCGGVLLVISWTLPMVVMVNLPGKDEIFDQYSDLVKVAYKGKPVRTLQNQSLPVENVVIGWLFYYDWTTSENLYWWSLFSMWNTFRSALKCFFSLL